MKKKSQNKMTPAEVAKQLALFIAKQEETLQKYPVGPLANAARQNLKKGMNAMSELQKQNEAMRLQKEPQAQQTQQQMPQQMALGGDTPGNPVAPPAASAFSLTPYQEDFYQYLINNNVSPEISIAMISATDKESGGQPVTERSYSGMPAKTIRAVNSRFKERLASLSDAEVEALAKNPQAFFEHVYGKDAKNLGNTQEGDGYNFRGRGILQITGRANYEKMGERLFNDKNHFINNPEDMNNPDLQGAIGAEWALSWGKGIEGYLDFPLNTTNLTPDQVQQVQNGMYASVASGGTLPKDKAQDSNYMSRNYAQYDNAMGKMQNWTQQALPLVQGMPAIEPAATPAPTAKPSAAPKTSRDTFIEAALQDMDLMAFLQRNEISTDQLMKVIDGDYVDVPNRSALDSYLRRIQSSIQADGKPAPQQTAQSTGEILQEMSQMTDKQFQDRYGLSKDEYNARYEEAANTYPDQALVFSPKDDQFLPGTAMLPAAYSVTNIDRKPNGEPIFTSMKQEANYFANKHLGEAGLRQMRDTFTAMNEGQQEMGKYIGPLLGAAAMGPLGLGGYGAGATGTSLLGNLPAGVQNALNVGRGVLNAPNFGLAGTSSSFGGAGGALTLNNALTSYGLARGTATATGMGDAMSVMEVADSDTLTPLQKAEYFTGLGLDFLPAIARAPGVAANMMRGSFSNYPGRMPAFLQERGALRSAYDLADDAVYGTNEAANAARKARQATKAAADDAAKALQEAQQKLANATSKSSKTSLQRQVTAAENKLAQAQADDAAALSKQRSQQAIMQNATGRRGAAEDDLFRFTNRYDAPRQRVPLVPNLYGTNIPSSVNALGTLFPSSFDSEPVLSIPTINPAQPGFRGMPVNAADPTPRTGVGGGGSSATTPDTPTGTGGTEIQEVQQRVGEETPTSNVEGGPGENYNINMPNMSPLMAIPALASLASGRMARNSIDQFKAPQRPITMDIPNFDYRSNVGQQLQNLQEGYRAAGTGTNLQGSQQAALRTQLAAQQAKQATSIYQQDAQLREQAKQNYDRLAMATRNMNNTLRNKYMEDKTNFDNRITELRTQARQQPLAVLSSTAQDYLKNIYAPYQASLLEGIGRQFNTNPYLTEDTP